MNLLLHKLQHAQESSSESELESLSESSADEDNRDACQIWFEDYPPKTKVQESTTIKWIGCDNCKSWYHMVCEGATDADRKIPSYLCNYKCNKENSVNKSRVSVITSNRPGKMKVVNKRRKYANMGAPR